MYIWKTAPIIKLNKVRNPYVHIADVFDFHARPSDIFFVACLGAVNF